MLDLTVIIPVYKSASTLRELHQRIADVCQKEQWRGEIIYVNDCSPDHSLEILKSLPHIIPFSVVDLRKNVGQSSALLTGMTFAEGNFIATMDADLQDEPEFLPALLSQFQDRTDVVFARRSGHYESAGRLLTSFLFKSLIVLFSAGRVPMNAGLFMILRKTKANAITSYLPQDPYLIGAIAKAGLRCSSVASDRKHNALGETSYTFKKRLKVAMRFLDTLQMKPLADETILKQWLDAHIKSVGR